MDVSLHGSHYHRLSLILLRLLLGFSNKLKTELFAAAYAQHQAILALLTVSIRGCEHEELLLYYCTTVTVFSDIKSQPAAMVFVL